MSAWVLGVVVILGAGGEHRRHAEDAARLLKQEVHSHDAPCTAYDDGRPFATCFDPWKGLELGGAVAWTPGGVSPVFVTGIRFRGARESRSKADSTWLDLHRVGATALWTDGGQPAVASTLWNGYFRRHVAEGVLLLPTSPPKKLPFPLDIALQADVLRWDRRVVEGDDWALEPLRLAVLLDPLRSSSSRVHLGVGALAGYRVRSVGDVLLHDITPLTAATLFLDLESDDGLWVLRGTATAGWTFAPGAPAGVFRARGELDASRVLVAFNDQPVSVFVQARGAWADAGARGSSELLVSAGLRLQVKSAR